MVRNQADLNLHSKVLVSFLILCAFASTTYVGGGAFFNWAFACGLVFLFAAHPPRSSWITVAIVGIAFGALYSSVGKFGGAWPNKVAFYCGMLGRGCLVVLTWRFIWTPPQEKKTRLAFAAVPSGVVVFTLASAIFLNLNTTLHSALLDLYLYAFDGSLGVQLSFCLGKFVDGSPAILRFVVFIYQSLPFVIGLVCAGHLVRSSPWRILGALASAGVLGYISYFFFPASGPFYIWGARFPSNPHTLAELRSLSLQPLEWPVSTPRNAMPSLHTAWAFLLCFYCRPFPRKYRWLVFSFVALTILSTLSLGEHYLADLVVAVPFSVAVYALWSEVATRQIWITAALTFALAVLWMAILRYDVQLFFLSPILPWTCIMVSTGLSLILVRRVQKPIA